MKQGFNIYLFLLLKLLTAVVLLLLTQVSFYIFNTRLFHFSGFGEVMGILWGNVRFAFSTMATVLIPYVVFNLLPFRIRWNRAFHAFVETVFYYLPVILVIAVDVIDLIYYQFTYRRMSAEMFSYMEVGGNMGSLIPRFVADYWYAILLFVGLMFVFFGMCKRLRLADRGRFDNVLSRDMVGFCLGLLLTVWLARGGVQQHWLPLETAGRYCQLKNSALVTNSAYSLLATIGKSDTPATDAALGKPNCALPMHLPATDSLYISDSLSRKNVVIIVLESFSQEYMGCYNQGVMESRTPFLDSLAQHSLIYQGRSNGKKSIEGIPAILASVPTMVEKPFIMTDLCSDSLFSIARLLSAHGYGTSFFHNGYNGVLGFDRMARQMGFSNYYGMNEYNATPYAKPEDYDGMWGIFDEPFLQYFGRELSHQPQPFLAVEFTASSHHPYTMPDSHKGEFPDGLHPLLPVVSYTDYALRRFFDSVAQQPWFYNTIFVITADHPGQGLHRQYNDYDGWYDIPMMFFAPGDSLAGVSHRLMQQLDVLPTLADMLHLPDTFACLGVSAVASPRIGSQVLYGNGYYMMLRNDLLRPQNHSYVAIEGRYVDGDRTMRQDLIDFIGAYNHYLEQQQTANGRSSSTN